MEKQMSILDLLDFYDGTSVEIQTNVGETEDEVKIYLQKGEKLISLLKSKALRKSFKKSDFLETVRSATYCVKENANEKMAYLIKCSQKWIHSFMKKVPTEGLEVLQEMFFHEWANYRTYVEKLNDGCAEEQLMNLLTKTQKEPCYVLKKPNAIREIHFPCSDKVKISRSQMKSTWTSKKMNLDGYKWYVQPDVYFAEAVILLFVKKYVKTLKNDVDIRSRLLHRQLEHMNTFLTPEGKLSVSESVLKEVFVCDYISQYFSEDQIDVTQPIKMDKWDFVYLYCCTNKDTESYWMQFLPEGPEKWRYKSPKGNRITTSVFDIVYDDYLENKRQDYHYKQMNSGYAKSYQDKKNISFKIATAMSRSSFNEYFAFVEYDNDVDLEKMHIIEKEWQTLASYFSFEKKEDVTLRFRRLGNHKAAGLYYSIIKCICIDVRHPSSMFHEYMHMLDHTCDEASRKEEFFGIRQRYAYLLNREVKEKKLSLTGKYDLNYYLCATEIFARCGEIYATRILGIDNNLVKPETSFAYPEDAELERMIAEYYDLFLKKDHTIISLKEE